MTVGQIYYARWRNDGTIQVHICGSVDEAGELTQTIMRVVSSSDDIWSEAVALANMPQPEE